MASESPQCPQAGVKPSRTATLDAASHAVDAVDAAFWAAYSSGAQIEAVTHVLGRLSRDQLLAVATVLVMFRPPQPPAFPGEDVAAWIEQMRRLVADQERS